MAPGLHGSARTTPRVRAELQRSQATTCRLAARYGLNPKTVAKWRRRTTVTDAPMGPRRPRSTVLTEAEEATIVVEFCTDMFVRVAHGLHPGTSIVTVVSAVVVKFVPVIDTLVPVPPEVGEKLEIVGAGVPPPPMKPM